jgi:hypothetical protein
MAAGSTLALSAATLSASGAVLKDRAVEWRSTLPSVASVSSAGLVTTGLVTGAKAHQVTITATSEGIDGTASLTITPTPVATVVVGPTTTAVAVGGVQQMTVATQAASGTPLTDRSVAWESGDLAIATVSNTGMVTATAYTGSATRSVLITATSEGRSGSASLSITPTPVAATVVSPATASLFVGAARQLTATTLDAASESLAGRTVAWSSSDATKATVSGGGLLTAIAAGNVTVVATSEGKSGSANITVQPILSAVRGQGQTGQILQALPIIPSVRVVDSQGVPRPGVVLAFAASGAGYVANVSASTGADGVASAGAWTLGDEPGIQTLTARFENSSVVIQATGTGTPSYFSATALALGSSYSCALTSQAFASCWGESAYLGTGAVTDVTSPSEVTGGRAYGSIDASGTHVCALTAAGVAYCWGNQGIYGSGAGGYQLPTTVEPDTRWRQLSTGFAHNCGIALSGKTYCWGSVDGGQIGDGSQTPRDSLTLVAGGFSFSEIRASTFSTCALTSDGTAYCWGLNLWGELGEGSSTTRTTPTAVVTTLKFRQLSTRGDSNCGLTVSHQVACWGHGYGYSPSVIAGLPPFFQLASDGNTSCALTSTGTAYCWGANGYGQIGDGTTTARGQPTPVAGGYRFSAIGTGGGHTCGITLTQGAVACWGRNENGQLGDGTKVSRLIPRRIVTAVIP